MTHSTNNIQPLIKKPYKAQTIALIKCATNVARCKSAVEPRLAFHACGIVATVLRTAPSKEA